MPIEEACQLALPLLVEGWELAYFLARRGRERGGTKHMGLKGTAFSEKA